MTDYKSGAKSSIRVEDEISHCVRNDILELWVLRDETLRCAQGDKGHQGHLIRKGQTTAPDPSLRSG